MMNSEPIKIIKEKEPEVNLSDEQKKILDIALAGTSLFFTGPAGTGKLIFREPLFSRQIVPIATNDS